MATRRRDAFPGKERATPSPQTGTAKLRGAVNQISKPKASTAPQKQTASRPASRTPTTTTDVSKLQTRKPASSTTAKKPAQTRTRSLDTKIATPTQKTRVLASAAAAAPATGANRRSSSLPAVKAVAAAKPASVKKWKPVDKEEGKRRLSTTSVGNGRRSSTGFKKEKSGNSASATKEQQITSFHLDKNEDLSMYSVPEPEMRLQDIEYSYLAEAEEKTVQSLSDFEKGFNDVVRDEDQEPLSFAKIEDVINHADPTVVIAESATVSEQQETPVSNDVIEETASKLRELRKNKVRALAGAFETVISLQEK